MHRLVNICQAIPYDSTLWSACRKDPPSMLPWSVVVAHLRQAAMSSRFQCVHPFRHSQFVDFTVCLWAWSLESASPMYIFFPGPCLISLKWNLIRRILSLWIHGRSWSTVWVLRSGTRGLSRSVSTQIDFPMICSQDCSRAQVSARAFFSICANLVSLRVIAPIWMKLVARGRQVGIVELPRPGQRRRHQLLLFSLFGSYKFARAYLFQIALEIILLSILREQGFQTLIDCLSKK